ncbi:MAG: GNAT family N-acetyltransferase [Microbacterium sp.]|uniref:GNAT family N-acetyltransferase n=1 Tax=Microbacterium sp. TaxID=51671 RepID=UPI0039E716A6
MPHDAYLTTPPSAASARLAGQGLDTCLVDTADGFEPWLQVVTRAFLGSERSPEEVASARERTPYRRKTGVYDAAAAMPDWPVATIASWVAELTVPGGGAVPASAISSVTVSPTHRRRGIARVLLEEELRLAAASGLPLSVLTVSESTIYGRYGFGAAAAAASLVLDVKRAAWAGPTPGGRVDFVSRERWRDVVAAVHERARGRDAGELDMPAGHFDLFAGTLPESKDAGAKRAVQYADEAGEVRGAALYTLKENDDDFTKATVRLEYLAAETPDAYAALWRFFVELDLVAEVRASELSVDEPLLWMISDQRAARVTVSDHHYVRVLDVTAALSARRYGAAGRMLLEVDDPLGYAAGTWLLEVDDEGVGTVSPAAGAPDDAVRVRLGVTELSAAYLGGVSLATLADAGRVQTTDAALAARVFGWHRPPRLSFWY